MLAAEAITVRLPGFTLGPLDLHVEEGEYFAVLGPSGAGKSTLLQWLAGFYPRAAGRLAFNGRELHGAKPAEREMGVVFQDGALFPHLSARDNLAFPLRLRGWEPERIDRRVAELARTLRIENRLEASPQSLSHGEARRVSLGRALATGSRVLLLDEPLQGLDPALRRDLRIELGALHRELGLTVVHVTHDLEEATALASRVAVMLHGRVRQVGVPGEIFDRPADADVARYLLVANFVEGTADAARGVIALASGLELPAPVRSDGAVHARFEAARLHPVESAGAVPARVLVAERRGDSWRVLVLPDGEPVDRILEVDSEQEPTRGARVWIDMREARWTIY